jgi:hypothetical protein
MAEGRGGWRVVGASVTGSAHLRQGLPCQDRHIAKLLQDASGTQILVVAVADGASSAERSEKGADVVLESFAGLVLHTLRHRRLGDVSVGECRNWLLTARQALLDAAASEGVQPREFAVTFAAAVVGADYGLALQIGDGIVASTTAESGWQLAVWPQKTRFLTDGDAAAHILVRPLPAAATAVAVCSDGLDALCLDWDQRAVFSPFFAGVFQTVAGQLDESCGELKPALERYLSSDAVNDLTDDDKTLVMAVWRGA